MGNAGNNADWRKLSLVILRGPVLELRRHAGIIAW